MFYVNGAATQGPGDWQQALQRMDQQWKPGFSAWELAHCWEGAKGFPPEIKSMLRSQFPDVELVKGLIEYRVGLPGTGGSSHNDLFVVARAGDDTLCIAVEGKVSEKFGPRLREWHTGTGNRETRLAGLCELIGLDRAIVPDTIRYQLLHRLASPVIEAQKRTARHAIMLIHSFSGLDASFVDFAAFLALYAIADVQPGRLYHLKTAGGVALYAGWAHGDSRYLSEQAAGER